MKRIQIMRTDTNMRTTTKLLVRKRERSERRSERSSRLLRRKCSLLEKSFR